MKKVLTWLKGLHWLEQLGLILSFIALALMIGKAGRKQGAADRAQQHLDSLLVDKTKKNVETAAKKQIEKDKHLTAAIQAKEGIKTQLEKIGDQNQTFDQLAHDFNSKRLRKRDPSEPAGS